jgi:hypothetical protein
VIGQRGDHHKQQHNRNHGPFPHQDSSASTQEFDAESMRIVNQSCCRFTQAFR